MVINRLHSRFKQMMGFKKINKDIFLSELVVIILETFKEIRKLLEMGKYLVLRSCCSGDLSLF